MTERIPQGMRDVTAEAERIAEERGYRDASPKKPTAENGQDDSLPLEWFGTAELQTDLGDFVEGTLTDGGMSVVYGESNSGKTFFAFDLGLRVALGWPWQGRETEQGGVLYLGCEGGYGVRNREIAFRIAHDVSGPAPFATVRASVNLKDEDGDCIRVMRAAEQMRAESGYSVRLIIVDTLARALAGGEENSSQDMGALVRQVDRLRYETGAHVMLIHHSGKDTAKGARGHSSLRAATDTELEVVRPEESETPTAITRKQRDLPGEGRFAFKFRQIELGTDRRGNTVTSCAVEPTDAPRQSTPRSKLSDKQRQFVSAVEACIGDCGEWMRPFDDMPLVRAADRQHLRSYVADAFEFEPSAEVAKLRSRIHDYLLKLRNRGILGFSRDYVWLVEDGPVSTVSDPSAPRQSDAGAYRQHRQQHPMGADGADAPVEADAQVPP